MRPTNILKDEHRVIEQVLDCLDCMAERCSADGRLEAEPAREAIDFFRGFADHCHHGKEEQQLFPMMEQHGFPHDGGPLAVMRHEHDRGRELIRGMEEAIDGAAAGKPEACEAFVIHARGYLGMLREHIQKEDHCLFPMADNAFGESEQQELWRRFERVEREEIEAGAPARYVELADRLADHFGVAKNRVAAVPTCVTEHNG